MTDRIVMKKNDNEGAASLYRRFVKYFRSSGIQSSTKQNQSHRRKISKNIRKQDCINRITKRNEYEKAYREGKIQATHKK